MRCFHCELVSVCKFRQEDTDTRDFYDCTTRLSVLKDAKMGEHEGKWDAGYLDEIIAERAEFDKEFDKNKAFGI